MPDPEKNKPDSSPEAALVSLLKTIFKDEEFTIVNIPLHEEGGFEKMLNRASARVVAEKVISTLIQIIPAFPPDLIERMKQYTICDNADCEGCNELKTIIDGIVMLEGVRHRTMAFAKRSHN